MISKYMYLMKNSDGLYFFIYFLNFLLLFNYTCPHFPPLLSPALPSSTFHIQFSPQPLLSLSMGPVYIFLDLLFPLLSPLLSGHCHFVLYFHDPGSILFSCLFPLIGEIIWYLSFTTWLISLSLILSNSIHAVAKGRSSFFLLLSIPLCKCTIVF